jgi:hypothetical protein
MFVNIIDEHVFNSVFVLAQNVKKLLFPVTALLLCYPVSKEVPQFRWWFVGVGRREKEMWRES